MGDFSAAFNAMAQQLEERQQQDIKEKSRLQQYINLILTNVPSIMLVFDMEGKAVLASEEYFHVSAAADIEAIQGKQIEDLLAPLSPDDFSSYAVDLFTQAVINRQTMSTEHKLDFSQGGHYREYVIHVTPMMSDDDEIMGVMVVFNDMTEIIEAQHAAEYAREVAEQHTRAKTEFLAMMSHEMRTPMNAIIGMTAIGSASPEPERKDDSFQKISVASQHLLGVINDILDMSKIEADKLVLDRHEFKFESTLNHIKSIIGIQAVDKEQSFTMDIGDEVPPYIISDEQRLAQVITNLLSNAIKFTPKAGTISLKVSKVSEDDGECVLRFEVKDSGIGISQEHQKLLFLPFEQADGSISRQYGGTGLGLAISKRIIELMDGDIWVDSEPGKGSTFTFEIRATRGAGDMTVTAATDEDDGGADVFPGKRILVAEDVDINREILAALLEDSGINIDFAMDGQDAVDMFEAGQGKYNLILMDIHMPLMDGYEATRRIRAAGLQDSQSIPIIAMTANVFREDVERCVAAGMNGHLGKPIDIQAVFATLKEHLN